MTDFAVRHLPLPGLVLYGMPDGYWIINCGVAMIAICHNRETAERIAALLEHHGLLLEIAEPADQQGAT